jgi:voltage-gated sodium channel
VNHPIDAASGGTPTGLSARLHVLTTGTPFQGAVIALILVNAAVMGLETSAGLREACGGALDALNTVIQAAFVAEIALRLLAHRPVGAFFRDGWNVFDFAVVAVSLLPAAGSLATVARVARVLRVARLVSLSPELRLIVATMLRSIPSMGHVVALLAILLYVYGVLGYELFHAHDPEHWGTLGTALLSLFQVLTLEGWADMQREAMQHHPWAWLYFTSFVVIAVFVVVNLFIAVVINNLEQVKAEERDAATAPRPGDTELRAQLASLRAGIDALEAALDHRDTR